MDAKMNWEKVIACLGESSSDYAKRAKAAGGSMGGNIEGIVLAHAAMILANFREALIDGLKD